MSAKINSLPNTSDICFSRLSCKDIPRISKFLMTVWPKLYGTLGHPFFNEDYLHWLFGGTNSDKHILVGAWQHHDLIAYQSFLYRRIAYCGKPLNAYLNTHTTISPKIHPSLRMYCALNIAKQHALFSADSPFYTPDCNLIYAFNDVEKQNVRTFRDRMLKKHFNITRTIFSTFNYFVVIPAKVKKYLHTLHANHRSFTVRAATELDCPALSELFNRCSGEPRLVMQMTEEEVRHHFFGRHDHHTVVIDQEGTLKGLVNFYPLRIVKEDSSDMHVVIEFLVLDAVQQEYAAHLLHEVVAFAQRMGTKTIVFENATYLDYTAYQPIGLMPTMRKMTMSVTSKNDVFEHTGVFRCDVK